MATIENLTRKDHRLLRMARSMAEAFQHEPNFAYMLPDTRKRLKQLVWFFGSFVAPLGLRLGEVHASQHGESGSIWMRPGSVVSFSDAVSAGLLAMPFHLGVTGTRRSLTVGGHIESIRNRKAPRDHWYLMALGVRPRDQGNRLGTALVKPVIEKANRDRVPCYLETFKERTAAFYEQFGFEVIHTDAVPQGGPPFWCMIRRPSD